MIRFRYIYDNFMKSPVREKFLFLVIFLLFINILSVPVKFIEPDDKAYYVGMRAFSEGKLTLTDSELENFNREIGPGIQYNRIDINKWVLEKAPGYAFILSLFFKLGIHQYTNIIIAAPFVLAFYFFVKKKYDRNIAFFSTIILTFNATFIGMLYRVYMSDLVSMILVSLSVMLYIGLVKKENLNLFLTGLFAGLAFIMRYTNIVIYVALFLHICITYRRDIFKILRSLFWIIIGSLIPAIIIILYNFLVFGKIWATGYGYVPNLKVNFAFQYVLWGKITTALNIILTSIQLHPSFLIRGFVLLIPLPIVLYTFRRSLKNRFDLLLLLLFSAYFFLYFQYEWLPYPSAPYTHLTRFYLPFLPVIAIYTARFLNSKAFLKSDGSPQVYSYIFLLDIAIFDFLVFIIDLILKVVI